MKTISRTKPRSLVSWLPDLLLSSLLSDLTIRLILIQAIKVIPAIIVFLIFDRTQPKGFGMTVAAIIISTPFACLVRVLNWTVFLAAVREAISWNGQSGWTFLPPRPIRAPWPSFVLPAVAITFCYSFGQICLSYFGVPHPRLILLLVVPLMHSIAIFVFPLMADIKVDIFTAFSMSLEMAKSKHLYYAYRMYVLYSPIVVGACILSIKGDFRNVADFVGGGLLLAFWPCPFVGSVNLYGERKAELVDAGEATTASVPV